MDKQKVLDKVAKCFALANSKGASPTEAETALRQARALMKQYNLESLEVAAHSINEASVVTGTKRAPQDWAHRLASICAQAFDGSYLAYFNVLKGWSFKFLGKGISPELAAHAYSALHHQLVAARQEFVAQQKRCQLKTKRRRGQLFAEGWLNAVTYKIVEISGTTDETTDLEIKAYLKLHHPTMSLQGVESLEAKGYDTGSLSAGWAQGQKVRLHRGVGQSAPDALPAGGAR
ncbi:DUF2786 domain-containing protein [Pseudomonas gingeri]|uniref:DUF2786 domain-containing protein n=1 Tax=Pseudomonas gingeri TaxID=117681 RepID=UPI00159FB44B|nr:DUF2786 domain-containing protein [Pseudomonas gingeri]NWA29222.1 DUF2786 domain-containing protein [Pseudomonas gingeri]